MGHFIKLGSAVLIGGHVYHGRPFCQTLCLDFHGHEDVKRLAKAFKAIQTAVSSIRDFYRSLMSHPPSKDSVAHLLPCPTPLDSGPLPALMFKCRFTQSGFRYVYPREREQVRSAMYIATLDPPAAPSKSAASATVESSVGSVEVVVKFTAR